MLSSSLTPRQFKWRVAGLAPYGARYQKALIRFDQFTTSPRQLASRQAYTLMFSAGTGAAAYNDMEIENASSKKIE